MSDALPARTRALAVAALVANAFTWGVSWWPMRQLQGHGLHPLWLTALVFGISVVLVSMVRPRSWGVLLRQPGLWGLALAAGTTNASFNWAVTSGDVVRVVLLFYLMPLWAVLLARVLLGERVSRLGLLRVVLALAGALVVLWPADSAGAAGVTGWARWPLPRSLPDWLGLLGGFSFALNNVLLRRQSSPDNGAVALAMFGGGALVSLVLASVLGQAGVVPWPPLPGWPWALGVPALALWFLLSNLTLQYGAARLPANTTAVVMLTEVLFASGSAVALGAGSLTPRLLAGGVLIVTGALLATLPQR